MKQQFHRDWNWKESNILNIEILGIDITWNGEKP